MIPEGEHREELEAQARELMARHAAISPRGHETTRQRTRLHQQIDDVLDQLAGNPSRTQLALLAAYLDDPVNSDPHTLACKCGTTRHIRNHTLLCRWCDTTQHNPDDN